MHSNGKGWSLDGDAHQLADEPMTLTAMGLPPGAHTLWRARFTDDLGQLWSARFEVPADHLGRVRLVEVAPFGLLTDMRPPPGAMPYPESATTSLRPLILHVTVWAEHQSRQISVIRSFVDHGVTRRDYRYEPDGITGSLFTPAAPDRSPAALVLGGSGGGLGWSAQVAGLLASRGLVTLALAYFDWTGADGLPGSLTEIPVEYGLGALDLLASQRGVDPGQMSVVGYSKGAEYALLLAAHTDTPLSVAAVSPSSHVWQAAQTQPGSVARSSWTVAGRPLPFLPLEPDTEFYRTYDKRLLYTAHQAALALPDAARARIPVERIHGPLLLVAGSHDGVWPAAQMADLIAGVREAATDPLPTVRQHHAGAGHFLNPPGLPLSPPDGDAVATHSAIQHAWSSLQDFLGVSSAGDASGELPGAGAKLGGAFDGVRARRPGRAQ